MPIVQLSADFTNYEVKLTQIWVNCIPQHDCTWGYYDLVQSVTQVDHFCGANASGGYSVYCLFRIILMGI